jgi:hypothetical protein
LIGWTLDFCRIALQIVISLGDWQGEDLSDDLANVGQRLLLERQSKLCDKTQHPTARLC